MGKLVELAKSSLRSIVPFFLILGACAHYPHTIATPLGAPAGASAFEGYRFENFPADGRNSDSLFVILTFSGGGTRAAALAYGVLRELAHTPIDTGSRTRSLLDEVDVISTVSGGSFAGAFYALYGPDSLEAFESRFLTWNAESTLKKRMLSTDFIRLAAPAFSRSDVATETWDRRLFRGATFGTLVRRRKRPYLLINATDVGLGSQFSFTQAQFDPLCADLSRFMIARAVAASSAFPILLTPITLENRAGSCAFREPTWVGVGLAKEKSSDDYRQAWRYLTYTDVSHRPYIHLFDGGPSDNLGVRPIIQSLQNFDQDFSLLRLEANGRLRRVVIIVVDARSSDVSSIDKNPNPPGVFDVLRSAAGTPFDNFSYESIALLKILALERLNQRFTTFCYDRLTRRIGQEVAAPKPVPLQVIHLTFADVDDPIERQFLLLVPTSFSLPISTVKRVRDAGAQLLRQNAEFKALLSELRYSAKPNEISCSDVLR
jgi:predicted acylesterase/phospholipase RssA